MTTSAQTTAAHTGRYKRSIRNYLIDSRFQLKYTAMIVFVTLAISGALGALLWRTSRAVIAESEQLVNESRKVSEVSMMNIKNMGYDDPSLLADFQKEADEYDKKLNAKQQSVVKQQNQMLYSIGGGLALMIVLIGLLAIYFTHKVAGPIFKMKRLLNQVGEGKLVFDARLRKGDELQEFFEAFSKMVERLRERQQREVDELDKAIKLAASAGVSSESIARVEAVRDEMKQALEAAP